MANGTEFVEVNIFTIVGRFFVEWLDVVFLVVFIFWLIWLLKRFHDSQKSSEEDLRRRMESPTIEETLQLMDVTSDVAVPMMREGFFGSSREELTAAEIVLLEKNGWKLEANGVFRKKK